MDVESSSEGLDILLTKKEERLIDKVTIKTSKIAREMNKKISTIPHNLSNEDRLNRTSKIVREYTEKMKAHRKSDDYKEYNRLWKRIFKQVESLTSKKPTVVKTKAKMKNGRRSRKG